MSEECAKGLELPSELQTPRAGKICQEGEAPSLNSLPPRCVGGRRVRSSLCASVSRRWQLPYKDLTTQNTVWGTDPNPPPFCSPDGQLAAGSAQVGRLVSVNKEWCVDSQSSVLGKRSLPLHQRAGSRAELLPSTVAHTWDWSPLVWESGGCSLAAAGHTFPGHQVGTLSAP